MQWTFGDAIIVTANPQTLNRDAIAIDEVLGTVINDAAVRRSIKSIDPDEASVLMLTSGSTSLPKAVIQTQRMIAFKSRPRLSGAGRDRRMG